MGLLKYRRLFLKANPDPPWVCYFCADQINILGRTRLSLNVHHIDHNPNNDDITNLAPAHLTCHKRHHRLEQVFSEESERRRVESLRGRPVSAETRLKISQATTGRSPGHNRLGEKHSDESRAKMRESAP